MKPRVSFLVAWLGACHASAPTSAVLPAPLSHSWSAADIEALPKLALTSLAIA